MYVALGGFVVTCLSLNLRFMTSNPAEDNGFLRAIKIRSTTSFGGEVKLSVPSCKVFRYVEPTSMKKILRWQNFSNISSPSFS
jgi:hypothetical protein